MPRFRFTLEAVRELREHAETSAKEAFARELALGYDCDTALAEASSRVTAARGALELVPDEPVTAATLRTQHAYLERRELERTVAALNAAAQAERVDAGREALVGAARDLEALEQIKRRRLAEHRRGVERAELRLLDELGLRRADHSPPPAAA